MTRRLTYNLLMPPRPLLASILCVALVCDSAARARLSLPRQNPAPLSGPRASARGFTSRALSSGLLAPAARPALAVFARPGIVSLQRSQAAIPVLASGLPVPRPALATLAQGAELAGRAVQPSMAAIQARAQSETFWSRADELPQAPPIVAGPSPGSRLRRLGRGLRGSAFALVPPAALPQAAESVSLLDRAWPVLGVGAIIAGTFGMIRVSRWLAGWLAKRPGWSKQKVAAGYVIGSTLLMAAGLAGVLLVTGVPTAVVSASYTGSVSLALRKLLGNFVHGVDFLSSGAFRSGERIEMDGNVGVVSDLSAALLKADTGEGGEFTVPYDSLAGKIVIVHRPYELPAEALRFNPAKGLAKSLGLKGWMGALWASQDRRLWTGIGAVAGLELVPLGLGAFAAGWGAVLLNYGLAGALAYLTHRSAIFVARTVDRLAERNHWPLGLRAVIRLLTRFSLYALGASLVLLAVGVSWITVATSLGATIGGIGIAINSYFGSISDTGEVLALERVVIGRRARIGSLDGLVVDFTPRHVVLEVGLDRHALVPYSVVRDAVVKSYPGPSASESVPR